MFEAPTRSPKSLRWIRAEALTGAWVGRGWCGLGWVWLGWVGLIEYVTDPNPTPRPNKSIKQTRRGFLGKLLYVGPVPPEVPPLDFEKITFATWGSAGLIKDGHQRYVGWAR